MGHIGKLHCAIIPFLFVAITQQPKLLWANAGYVMSVCNHRVGCWWKWVMGKQKIMVNYMTLIGMHTIQSLYNEIFAVQIFVHEVNTVYNSSSITWNIHSQVAGEVQSLSILSLCIQYSNPLTPILPNNMELSLVIIIMGKNLKFIPQKFQFNFCPCYGSINLLSHTWTT